MRVTIHLAMATMTLAVLTGCGASQNLAPVPGSTDAPGAEQAEVSQALADQPDVVEDGLFAGLDETVLADGPAAGPGGASIEAPIHPFHYWRHIRSVDRRFEFAFSDTDSVGRPTRAVVTIHKLLRGSFNIAAGEPTTDRPPGTPRDSAIDVIRKPLVDHWVRRVMLQRVRPEGDSASGDERHRRPWRIIAASGVKITSQVPDARPTRITSLRVQSAGVDVTVTDPLELRRLFDVLKFEPQTEVEVTVTTERPDDVVVLLHRDHRFRLLANGDNTYTGKWRAPLRMGFHHLGVNALDRNTLFDDRAPYSSQAWILHYVIRGGEPVTTLEP